MDILADEKPGLLEAAEGIAPSVSAAEAFLRYSATGMWTITHADHIEKHLRTLIPSSDKSFAGKTIEISLKELEKIDTSGAWLLLRFRDTVLRLGGKFSFRDVEPEREKLIAAISDAAEGVHSYEPPPRRILGYVDSLRKWFVSGVEDTLRIVALLGALTAAFAARLRDPRNFRVAALVTHMMRTGLTAVPIISLMSFVIGAIIAQQGAYQLSFYGADPMAVDMVAVLVTRDMGVLLTAIMISGRSGSAYTAEIGSMKMREEIDALKVIGLDPVDVLLFPRILALILVLPLLTIIADYASLLGAQLALWLYIDMSYEVFLQRTRDAVPLHYFLMGVVKAPFMALVIGLIAMSEGLKVEGSSESLSRHTTISVVKSIFMVILIDGVFAVISASLGY